MRLEAAARVDQVRLLVMAARAARDGSLGAHVVVDDAELVLAELLNNVVIHGVPPDQGDGPIMLEVTIAVDAEALVLEVADGFAPYVPPEVPDAPPGDLAEGGYGTFLVHSLMDEVRYERQRGRNVVIATRRLGAPA
jgi:serine/threonine-protein kinase RsbW